MFKDRFAEHNIYRSAEYNADRLAKPSVGVGFIPILQAQGFAELNVGVGFIPTLQGFKVNPSPLLGELEGSSW